MRTEENLAHNRHLLIFVIPGVIKGRRIKSELLTIVPVTEPKRHLIGLEVTPGLLAIDKFPVARQRESQARKGELDVKCRP